MKIGLEVHVYVPTQSKLFCRCPTGHVGAKPNENVCPSCTAQPGAKPLAVNREVVRRAIELAAYAGGKPAKTVSMLRKHYFYPDLPANYQRTGEPFCVGGALAGVALREIHWEEDAGEFDPRKGLVDFNRAGVPLFEVVTQPVLRSPCEARAFLSELRYLLHYLGYGEREILFKVDANISVGGERVEIKNINSIKGVETALEKEAARQKKLLAKGESVERVTLHFDDKSNDLLPSREKESIDDYRFMADPDIPLVTLDAALVESVSRSLSENPFALRQRLEKTHKLDAETARVLCSEPALAASFLACIKKVPVNLAAPFYKIDVKRELAYRCLRFREADLDTDFLVGILKKLQAKEITSLVAVQLLRSHLDKRAVKPGKGPSLPEAVALALRENVKAVADYRKGKKAALQFLLGQTRKLLPNGAPEDIEAELKKQLS